MREQTEIHSLKEHHSWVKAELDHSLAFWLQNGMDLENGGIYTCLGRRGERLSKDKGVWMQGRSAWTFSRLCTLYGRRQEWLEAAKSCIDYMERTCFDNTTGRMYLAILETGEPTSQGHQCFSEAFYTIGNAEYGFAADDGAALARARSSYELIWRLNNGLMEDPAGPGAKTMLGDQRARAHADPMIYLNVSSILRRCDPENRKLYEERMEQCVHDILCYHYRPELSCTLEKVLWEGTVCDSLLEGRIVNPGHDIECCWFLLEAARELDRPDWREAAEELWSCAVSSGWDRKRGGLFSFLDCRDNSIPKRMHLADQKTWWPHCEGVTASLMLYRDTGKQEYLDWFNTFISYVKKTFSDPDCGEWYCRVDMEGVPPPEGEKGNIYKGPFHLPRMLLTVDQLLTELTD